LQASLGGYPRVEHLKGSLFVKIQGKACPGQTLKLKKRHAIISIFNFVPDQIGLRVRPTSIFIIV
jgi:hypothetical protein